MKQRKSPTGHSVEDEMMRRLVVLVMTFALAIPVGISVAGEWGPGQGDGIKGGHYDRYVKEKAAKEKADKEKADKEKADKEKADKYYKCLGSALNEGLEWGGMSKLSGSKSWRSLAVGLFMATKRGLECENPGTATASGRMFDLEHSRKRDPQRAPNSPTPTVKSNATQTASFVLPSGPQWSSERP